MATLTQVNFAATLIEAIEMILESCESATKVKDVNFNNGGVQVSFDGPVPSVVHQTVTHFSQFLKQS